VSRALSGKGRIGEATRERIRSVADELGYRPNVVAHSLATNRTRSVGVVIHERHRPFEGSFYNIVLEMVEAELDRAGYQMVFSCLRRAALPRCVTERRVDALVCLGTDFSDDLVRRLRSRMPVVLADNSIPGVDSVLGDNVGGARRAAEHLMQHGHTRVGFIAETLSDPSFRARMEGYGQALEAQGLSGGMVFEGGRRRDSDRVAMRRLLATNPVPTALVAANDFMAAGAITALVKTGYRVPQDVAVVSFDDGELATVVEPQLTSVRIDRAEMGALATRRVLELIAAPESPPLQYLLPTTLTIRASCGCNPD